MNSTAAHDAVPDPSRHRAAQRSAILEAARRLIDDKGESFTTQDLIKEAGVALQTFYRYFGGKDQLLLAVIQDMIAENCARFDEQAQHITDPLERLHAFVAAALSSLDAAPGAGGPRFITSEHWRLHQLFPDEMAEATKPFTDLVQRELERAAAAGLVAPADHERDAWLIARLVISTFHHYAFHLSDPKIASASDDVWSFCLRAIGSAPAPSRRRALSRRRR